MQVLSILFLTIYTLAIVGVILVIITDNRNPLKSVPWIIVLLLAPVVGLVFYFFFGQNLSKQRIISRRTRRRINTRLEVRGDIDCPRIPERWAPLSELLVNTIQAVPLYGSRITPYTDGRPRWMRCAKPSPMPGTTSICNITSFATTAPAATCATCSSEKHARESRCAFSTTTWGVPA